MVPISPDGLKKSAIIKDIDYLYTFILPLPFTFFFCLTSFLHTLVLCSVVYFSVVFLQFFFFYQSKFVTPSIIF